MRITGGELRGRRLHVPKSSAIRPMRDQVRAALFSVLGELVKDSRFLDLFAGTGSVGLEALSRGAAFVVFVDSSREAIEIIRRNVLELGLRDRAVILQDDVFRALERLWRQGERFDLVFIGPPYGHDLAHQTLEKLSQLDVLSDDAVVVTEVFKKERVESRYGQLVLAQERTYGDNVLKFYRLKREQEGEGEG